MIAIVPKCNDLTKFKRKTWGQPVRFVRLGIGEGRIGLRRGNGGEWVRGRGNIGDRSMSPRRSVNPAT